MKRSYSISIIPLMVKAIGLTILVTSGFAVIDAVYRSAERKLCMFELLGSSASVAAMSAIFGGAVAALAIHNSFQQSAREKRFELRITEHENAVGRVVDMIGRSIAVNTLPTLADMPDSMDEIRYRRQAIFTLYSFVEQNYTSVLTSGILFGIERENQDSKQLKEPEAKLADSQKAFADAYRRLYHALHDYVDQSLSGMETLYNVRDGSGRLVWVWERMGTSYPDAEIAYLEMWESQHGRNFSDEVANAWQTQQDHVARITQYAVETRDALTAFSEQFKVFERAALLYGRSTTSSQTVDRLQAYKEYCAKNPIQ